MIGLKSYLNVFIRTARFLLLVFQPVFSLLYSKSTQIYLKLESRKYFNALPQLSCSQLFDSLWTSSVTYKQTKCECEHVVLLLQMLRPFLGLCGCNVQYFVPNVSPSGHVYFVCCIFVYLDFSISYIFRLNTDLHFGRIVNRKDK